MDQEAGSAERERQEKAMRAACKRAERIKGALDRLVELEVEKAGRAKADKRAAKRTQMVSLSGFEVRRMRLADGSVHPAWNVPVATARGFVVSIEPADRRNDSGLAPSPVEQIERRCGQTPVRLRADGTAMTVRDIATRAPVWRLTARCRKNATT